MFSMAELNESIISPGKGLSKMLNGDERNVDRAAIEEMRPPTIARIVGAIGRYRGSKASRIAMVCFASLRLAAHDLYLMPTSFTVELNTTIQVEFHHGDSFPESEAAPRPDQLKSVNLLSSAAVVPVAQIHELGKVTLGTVRVPGAGDLILSTEMAPNLIKLEPKDFNDYLKEEGLDDIFQWRISHNEENKPGREKYTKFAKSILLAGKPDDYYKHPVGFALGNCSRSQPLYIESGRTLAHKNLPSWQTGSWSSSSTRLSYTTGFSNRSRGTHRRGRENFRAGQRPREVSASYDSHGTLRRFKRRGLGKLLGESNL